VVDLRLRRDGPLIVTGRHTGSSNFIVDLVPRGASTDLSENVFNQIGTFDGQDVWADATAGRYRVKVQADGRWTLRFQQPVRIRATKSVPGRISGKGSRVIPIVSRGGFQAIITGRHQGESNFIVDLVGFGDTSGQENLFNEIGVFSGETLVDMPAGTFLLQVFADGSWSLNFRR
jgi:hypothetical protein